MKWMNDNEMFNLITSKKHTETKEKLTPKTQEIHIINTCKKKYMQEDGNTCKKKSIALLTEVIYANPSKICRG